MITNLNGVYHAITSRLPAVVAWRIDSLNPTLHSSWGGPLNGQTQRQAMIREIARLIDFQHVLETGTFRGTSTEFFSAVIGKPVDTVELLPRYYEYAVRRLRPLRNVTVHLGDSRTLLTSLTLDPITRKPPHLVYLDAHWNDDLPLIEELRIIAARWANSVVVIDDFQVPGDEGYGFDDYGPGSSLSMELLDAAELPGWGVFHPSASAATETGLKRGCVVLASPEHVAPLVEATSLRLSAYLES